MFSDEGIRELKAWIEYAEGKKAVNVMREMYLSELKPLIARLEAAELIREYAGAPQHEKWRLAEEAWLKSSGREEKRDG